MDKIKVGIPRGLSYYYFSNMWDIFFKELDIEVVKSPPTNKEIVDRGIRLANDEMCLSLKIYIGHVDYLKDKVDYIIVPRIDNYGIDNQTCTNFLAVYDIVNNLFNVKVLDYNISSKNDELSEFLKIGKILNKKRFEIIKAYKKAYLENERYKQNKIKENYLKLKSDRMKILLISHSYNTYDEYIGKPIINYLQELGVDIIYSDRFDEKKANKLSLELSKTIYFKYCKDAIGSIKLAPNVDGIIFLSSFPCGLDSLVNELVMRRINKPYINLVVDDMDSLTGIKTRLESFVDILEQKNS